MSEGLNSPSCMGSVPPVSRIAGHSYELEERSVWEATDDSRSGFGLRVDCTDILCHLLLGTQRNVTNRNVNSSKAVMERKWR